MADMKTWAGLIKKLDELGVKQVELIHIVPLDPPRGPHKEIAYLFEKSTGQEGKFLPGHLCHRDECTWEACGGILGLKTP